MSATDIRVTAGSTESGTPVRVGLKLPPPAPPETILISLILIGAIIGWLGSVLSVRRFLKRA